jgi:hypothetical protein
MMRMALFPLMNPITSPTASFGGMDRSKCKWSSWRWPSSTVHSRCRASSHSTGPRCLRSSSCRALCRYLGIQTTCYLHFDLAWDKSLILSIGSLSEFREL